MPLTVIQHPLAKHLVTTLRDETTPPEEFRIAARKLTALLVLEATADVPLDTLAVRTPLETTEGHRLARPLAAVPILRAGMGMLEAVVNLFPDVRVGYIGLRRDEETAIASQYMNKLPRLQGCVSLCLDPMLATGGSAAQAVSLMKEAGADDIRMVTVLVTPEGVERFEAEHPEVSIVTAAYDRQLDERKFILPGLGDFGDRLYGTF